VSGNAFAAFPAELRRLRRWVLWRTEERDGELTKVPYRPDGTGKARSNDPKTWGTFAKACATWEAGCFDGVGFMFSADDDVMGIDLDHMRDPATGEPSERARRILASFDTYAEVSPSRDGYHIILRGRLPEGARNRRTFADGTKIEIYASGRYFTVTGHAL